MIFQNDDEIHDAFQMIDVENVYEQYKGLFGPVPTYFTKGTLKDSIHMVSKFIYLLPRSNFKSHFIQLNLSIFTEDYSANISI